MRTDVDIISTVKWSRTSVFASGVVLGIVTMATGPILRRWSCPRPDIVLKSVLPQLRANNEVYYYSYYSWIYLIPPPAPPPIIIRSEI